MEIQKNCVLMLVVLLYLLFSLICIKLVTSKSLENKHLLQYIIVLLSAVAFGVLVFVTYSNSELNSQEDSQEDSEPVKESYNESQPVKKSYENFKKVPLSLVVANWCGYSKKQLKHLEQNNLLDDVEVLDIDNENDKKTIENYNIKIEGYPTWYCPSTKKSQSGYVTDLNMLHDKLTAKSVENFEPNKVQQLKDHNLVMIQAEWCSWCKKTKEMFKREGVENGKHIEIISPSESHELYDVKPEALPAFFPKGNPEKIFYGGFTSLDDLLAKCN